MNRIALAGFGAAALILGAASAASAMPIVPSPDGASPLALHVADGCGPGYFRGPRGFCRPMGYGPRPFYGPRPYYGGGPYGPRPRPYWDRPYRPW